jgi:hypothetical protein
MKLTGGQWVRMSWDDAINEIGDQMLDIRENLAPIQFTGSDLQSIAMSRPICSASFMLIGVQTTVTIRPVFVTQPQLPVLRTPGAMVR